MRDISENLAMENYTETIDPVDAADVADAAAESLGDAEGPVEPEASATPEVVEAPVKRHPTDMSRLVAQISIFHHKRLKMVASDRGISVDQLLEELIDRMWTYRGRQR